MAEVDLRGVACPTNYVRVRLALEGLQPGDELEVLLDDGEPVCNVTRSVRDDGDQVVGLEPEGDHFRLTVRKGEGVSDGW